MHERRRADRPVVGADVDVLAAELHYRQRLAEHLYRLQRAITRREALRDVLGDVCSTAADLLGDVIATVRLVDPREPSTAPIVAGSGLPATIPEEVRTRPADAGVSGRAMRTQRLVVAEDHACEVEGARPATYVVASAMAAPVTKDAGVVGALTIASRHRRTFTPLDQETVLILAEHVSLALNDASAVQARADALEHALHRATHDPLTRLPNRTLVLQHLAEAVGRPARRGHEVAVLSLDLDRFERINDLFGRDHGDAVLVHAAERLRRALRGGDTVGRLGDDEFVVVAEGLDDDQLAVLVSRVEAAVAQPIPLGGREAGTTTSVGVARARPGAGPAEVLEDADLALHRAKEAGRAQAVHFDTSMRAEAVARSETEQALRRAVREGELRVHYQPAVWMPGPRAVAVEALVRWERPGHGLATPGAFLDVAEETGLIREAGRWILEQACARVAGWRRHPLLAELQLSVNVSARQLTDPCLADAVADVLTATGLPAEALWLEMTEHVLLDEGEDVRTNVLALRAQGVHLVIDDFGTGYSSLAYLKRFPVEAIKVDRTFVHGLVRDAGDQAIVTAILRLGEALGLGVIAEGVEQPEQEQALLDLGCELGQGLLYGGAAPPDEAFERLLAIGR